ncbi:retrovirus-related pol polyprotein from transposon TNT 1-94 [Tanacetum coccineum]
MERFIQPNNDPLALVSDASVQQYPTQPSKSKEPSPADNFQMDSGSSSTENLIESLSNTLALLTQSYKSHLPQTNNQLRASSNARNKAMVQDGKVVVQDVRGRYNATNQGRPFQRNIARGNGVAGNVGGQSDFKIQTTSRTGFTNARPGEWELVRDEEQLLFFEGNMLPRVRRSTEANGSKPRSKTKKNRILPAKKEVEVRLRINKLVWTKVNLVDSSTSFKRVVINLNSESVCKTCNKSVNSASHGMCVVNILNSVNATPTVRIVLNKEKQIWKPKGKLSDNSLNKTKQIWKPKSKLSDNSLNKTKQIWKPKGKLSDNSLSKTQRVWKATGKLFADIGYQWRPTGKKLTLGKLDCGSQWRPTGKKFALGEICQFTKLSVKCSTLSANQQVMLWYLDSGCSKHMTGNRSKLMNFVEKFIGSVRFGNDHLGAIMGYGDYVMGDSVISRVYYVEGLGHNLFSVGQFCDSDLEVAFRKHTCFVRDLNGTDILKGSRGTNLYTISIDEMLKSSPICLLSKASKSKSWLWHRRLNHLNFGTINDLARKELVRGLPRLKFEKDHLCSACQLGKSKKFSHRAKSENTNMEVLHTLHMDLCGPMRVQSIKGKKYILVIVDDYSISHGNILGVGNISSKVVPRTPQQNGVVERRNRTLVEAARTMMIFSKAPMFLWAKAVATACYTQNRKSLIHTRHNKTPYELVHDKKPDLTFFRVFGALCYPTNDSENLGKF